MCHTQNPCYFYSVSKLQKKTAEENHDFRLTLVSDTIDELQELFEGWIELPDLHDKHN